MTDSSKKRRLWLWLAILLIVPVGVAQIFVCVPTWVRYGVKVGTCPDGELRPVLWASAGGLRRGSGGTVTVQALAHYTTGPADRSLVAPIGRLDDPALELLGPLGPVKDLSIDPKRTRRRGRGSVELAVTLPAELPDGDYRLGIKAATSLGPVEGALELPIFAPAKIHVLTDRPLYEPGNLVRFRAVALRARDMTPLDGRPGRFVVTDPLGEVVLEERANAGAFGVVEGSFPLDTEAASGSWKVEWSSGGTAGGAEFKVEPFTLPRFRVEGEASHPYYSSGETPRISGKVTYSSGAPVAGAILELAWHSESSWPLPTEWLEGALPKQAVADPMGRFELVLPSVPSDVRGLAPVSVSITAKDQTGDQVTGSARALLTQDRIQASAVTELESGVVEGFNNRVYLRATSPSGTVLSGTELVVKRAWEPTDPGLRAITDDDGVASFQLDPGPPVNVVVPPMPVRLPPVPPPVERSAAVDLFDGQQARLEDQAQLDLFVPDLHACARFVAQGAEESVLAIRVETSGRVAFIGHAEHPTSRCIADALRTKRLPQGRERLIRVTHTVTAPDRPRLSVEGIEGEPAAPPFQAELERQLLDARACLPDDLGEGPWPRLLSWSTLPDISRVVFTWTDDPRALTFAPVTPSALACVESRIRDVELPDPSRESGIGVARIVARSSPRRAVARPEATIMVGYELVVSASVENGGKREILGSTKLFIPPGNIPPLRIRATPVLARPGEKVEAELIRGPGFEGKLPEKLYLTPMEGSSVEAKLDPETRKVTFELPKSAKGWWRVEHQAARALVFVRSDDELAVAVTPDKERYSPGEIARLSVDTRASGAGTPAAVGLFGVDASLEQLTALLGVDEWEKVRPSVLTNRKAFDALDGAALALGRIRGGNAAAATVLRVSALPSLADRDVWVSANTRGTFDPVEALTDRFYAILSELHTVVREWERTAPEKEVMRPPKMAQLWKSALDRVAARGEPVADAFGRPLTLSVLPHDLLGLVAPRAVVVKGTRLPEDLEDWSGWVRRNRP
ncbi:MAG: hypothetical protein HYV07_15550 [Deltaproteobacteria bacterium]|nr:hypothetical protein [Deltaproteobacteria bacterium]